MSIETADLLKTWARAWAAGRGCAAPVSDGPGWRIDVGEPDQVRRHVFADDNQRLRELVETVTEPAVWIKACISNERLQAGLPARWTVRPTLSSFMRFDAGLPAASSLPARYAMEVETTGVVHRAIVRAADGTVAADGRMVILDGHAIFDRIATDAAHRRRGLGRAVMVALHARAHDRGAPRGLLVATEAGQALYETIGWTVQAPYASAVIEA